MWTRGVQAYRWIADSRDEASKKRLEYLDDSYKTYRCVLSVLTRNPVPEP